MVSQTAVTRSQWWLVTRDSTRRFLGVRWQQVCPRSMQRDRNLLEGWWIDYGRNDDLALNHMWQRVDLQKVGARASLEQVNCGWKDFFSLSTTQVSECSSEPARTCNFEVVLTIEVVFFCRFHRCGDSSLNPTAFRSFFSRSKCLIVTTERGN